MGTGMMRDHTTSNYPPGKYYVMMMSSIVLWMYFPTADAKYGREISSPVGSTHGQQGQQAAQAQQQGMWLIITSLCVYAHCPCVVGLQQNQGVHPFMNAAAIPYGNMFYANSAMLPSLYPTLGLPGFSPSVSIVYLILLCGLASLVCLTLSSVCVLYRNFTISSVLYTVIVQPLSVIVHNNLHHCVTALWNISAKDL